MKIFKKNFGITLIALVVTIIVLLILAGISVSMLTGQNGILNKAAEAKEKTEEAQKEEQIKLAVMSSIGTDGLINLNQLKTEIERQGGGIEGNRPLSVLCEENFELRESVRVSAGSSENGKGLLCHCGL